MTNGPTGPFERALHTFATGGPIPICVGAFGETNTLFDKLIIKLANLAAKTPYGRQLLPYPLDVVPILFFVFSSIVFSEFSLLKEMQGTN
jgi:hypothetical protein